MNGRNSAVALQYVRDSKRTLYVSTSVYNALWILAKSKTSELARVTPDEIADGCLRDMIVAHHPQLFTHQKLVDKMQKELIESLTK